jgi:hypothetical protein
MLNFANMLNSDWGVGQRMVNAQPLIVPTSAQGGPVDAQGRPQYRLRAPLSGGDLMSTTLESTAGINDVWRVQFSVRYIF